MIGGILPNGGCNKSHEQPQKTLSAEMRIACDCDIRAVTGSVPEVIVKWLVSGLGSLYGTHYFKAGG